MCFAIVHGVGHQHLRVQIEVPSQHYWMNGLVWTDTQFLGVDDVVMKLKCICKTCVYVGLHTRVRSCSLSLTHTQSLSLSLSLVFVCD